MSSSTRGRAPKRRVHFARGKATVRLIEPDHKNIHVSEASSGPSPKREFIFPVEAVAIKSNAALKTIVDRIHDSLQPNTIQQLLSHAYVFNVYAPRIARNSSYVFSWQPASMSKNMLRHYLLTAFDRGPFTERRLLAVLSKLPYNV